MTVTAEVVVSYDSFGRHPFILWINIETGKGKDTKRLLLLILDTCSYGGVVFVVIFRLVT